MERTMITTDFRTLLGQLLTLMVARALHSPEAGYAHVSQDMWDSSKARGHTIGGLLSTLKINFLPTDSVTLAFSCASCVLSLLLCLLSSCFPPFPCR